MLIDYYKGLGLAISSSVFIGASFIVKKKGLRRAAEYGVRAGSNGHGYLKEPLWWIGLLTMALGEAANFAAYAFAPAILVTPLGALSVIISTVLASFLLNETLVTKGKIGCLLCILGSTLIVLSAPHNTQDPESVEEILVQMLQPAFMIYSSVVTFVSLFLIFHTAPILGQSQVLVYVTICSLVGSLSVMGCKALGIALKLTFRGENQLLEVSTWVFALFVGLCIVVQMNYLNKALDIFNTAVVTPIYYVMFTTCTIIASAILYGEWSSLTANQILVLIPALLTVFFGVFTLHSSRKPDPEIINVV